MSSIRQIAEQAWLIYFPKPSADTPNRLREFILLTAQVCGFQAKLNYFERNQEGERQVPEVWLKEFEYDVSGECEPFSVCLQAMPLNLPNDIGVYNVAPLGLATGRYIKTTKGTTYLNTPLTKKRYYRIGANLFFPDGLYSPEKKVAITLAVVDETDFIPDELAPAIITQILTLFNQQQQNRKEDLVADTVDSSSK